MVSLGGVSNHDILAALDFQPSHLCETPSRPPMRVQVLDTDPDYLRLAKEFVNAGSSDHPATSFGLLTCGCLVAVCPEALADLKIRLDQPGEDVCPECGTTGIWFADEQPIS